MDYYSKNAKTLYDSYNSLNANDIHQSWKHHIEDKKGLALDVGAGSGRDSRWLNNKSWDVVAVEPCKKLREIAQGEKSDNSVTWVDDQLPQLYKIRALDYRFNLIIVSAVWMHLPERVRERAFRVLTDLLAPDGLLVITLRHGRNEKENAERSFYPVSREELEHFARRRAIVSISSYTDADQLNRSDIEWETCIFQLPDDGTGSLPILRNIIVNDNKAATYKLALLRSLIRIAEGCPGMVLKRTEDHITIPFGLLALYWIKLYMPLMLKNQIRQSPIQNIKRMTGIGFAKENHFYALSTFSTYDLRIGATFDKERASIIIGALNDVCATIKKMPANFITYPGQKERIFCCDRKTVKKPQGHWQITKDSLQQFGEFQIPVNIWATMGNFACWIEPTIVNEWIQLMMGYELRYDRSVFDRAMEWEEGIRDTSLVRNIVDEKQKQNEDVKCVWTNSQLRDKKFHVDHCFPWSRWANNDLWNLLPSTELVNLKKSEKLPSASILESSKDRIVDWWDRAYFDSAYRERFILEACTALPGLDDDTTDLEMLFHAMKHQRNRLRMNQQLVEWG